MKKIFIYTYIILLFCPQSLVYATEEEQNRIFEDIPENSYYERILTPLKEKDIISGYPDGYFRPHRQVNRVEALKMILEATDIKIQDYDININFTDIQSDWYTPYLETAVYLDIISGYPDGTFKPAQDVNKVEALKIFTLSNQIPLKAIDDIEIQLYQDTPIQEDTLWYQPYVYLCKEKNLITPVSMEKFNPEQNLTRGQIAEMIYRYLYINENGLDQYLYKEGGIASYYGNIFIGRKTASGEIFYSDHFTTAHKTLPLGTIIQVKNTANNKSVVVKVNDRGPFVEGRIIDLSIIAFNSISRISRGLFDSEIKIIGYDRNFLKNILKEISIITNTENEEEEEKENKKILVEFTQDIPSIFFENEFFNIKGKINYIDNLNIKLLDDSSEIIWEKEIEIYDNQFEDLLFFDLEGKYNLVFYADNTEIYNFPISIYKKQYFSYKAYIENKNNDISIKNLTKTDNNLNIKLANNAEDNIIPIFKLSIIQNDLKKDIILNNSYEFSIKKENSIFREINFYHNMKIKIYYALTSSVFSLDRYTNWKEINTYQL